ncbi:MAG: hypothetical protein R2939_08155 [Kofleriaceae bacterium]
MRSQMSVVLAVTATLSSGCAGYWSTDSTTTSRQRVGAPARSVQPFADAVYFDHQFGLWAAIGADCQDSWNVEVTTVRHERFRSTTSKGLWLGLGAITAAAGAVLLTTDDMLPLGVVLMTAGVAEMGYGLGGAIAGARRRQASSTTSTVESSSQACRPDAELAVAADWQMTTPWGGTAKGQRAGVNDNDLLMVFFNPAGYCEHGTCRQYYGGDFTLTHLPTGRSWQTDIPDDELRRKFP